MSEWEMKRPAAPPVEGANPDIELPRNVLAVMAMTTMLTFAALMTSYQLFFTHSVFA